MSPDEPSSILKHATRNDDSVIISMNDQKPKESANKGKVAASIDFDSIKLYSTIQVQEVEEDDNRRRAIMSQENSRDNQKFTDDSIKIFDNLQIDLATSSG